MRYCLVRFIPAVTGRDSDTCEKTKQAAMFELNNSSNFYSSPRSQSHVVISHLNFPQSSFSPWELLLLEPHFSSIRFSAFHRRSYGLGTDTAQRYLFIESEKLFNSYNNAHVIRTGPEINRCGGSEERMAIALPGQGGGGSRSRKLRRTGKNREAFEAWFGRDRHAVFRKKKMGEP